ncbi:unnamed protein product [Periconia digitata]|uniref:Uncharacterized protein n=1 Tax=Periconia digitata TaxID=1303443 RepID=A0A9W4XYI9_9PLEO|nr:unnamed protein product [Periconia digitata]
MLAFSTPVKLLTVLVSSIQIVSANTPIKWDDFWANGGHTAAVAAVPMYHFGRPRHQTPCYPQAGQTNGRQTNGSPTTACGDLGKGCADPGPWKGQNTLGNPFPVYYTVKECNKKVRVAYSIYYSHDSGHMSDWENVIVEWNGDGAGGWKREGLFLGYHGKWEYLSWRDVQNTVNGESDKFDQDAKDRDHPKVYAGAFYHAMFHTRKTSIDSCINSRDEFRSNDWYLLPGNDLVQDGNLILDGWDWGAANTNPSTLRKDLCKV